ncbi:hypothetical protein [Paractinoplanes atraurantiacus]|uniref:Uncharacterized protein n=1 Tax=Paractinoplanes atraurantiacus TaxID=1036182 RepID=A0A285HIH9_9ACTN|nr:hypothetical protein [Actinoplanes atraurantiacus]SNY35464.1 hypothetical protein SAMN05421748_104436 [Actinoplanes atraurantiacus]
MLTTRAVPAVLLLVLAAGCASSDPAAAPAPAPSASASPAPSASDVIDLPVPTKASGPTGEPSRPAAGAKTITGTVTAGVEPNCLLLSDSSGSYLLIFDDAAMRSDATVGRKVTVVGQTKEGMMSTCQQGTPLLVTSIRAA